jgi:arginine decarboxylase
VAVCRDLETTLSVMISRRAYDFGPIQSEVVGIGCHGRPVCALVLAVYRSEGWSDA